MQHRTPRAYIQPLPQFGNGDISVYN